MTKTFYNHRFLCCNLILVYSVIIAFILSAIPFYSKSQCAAAVNGNVYLVTDTTDNGPGSLREAILEANFDGVGGTIEVWLSTISINSSLPAITCDSLVVLFFQTVISGNNMVADPPMVFNAPHSCISGSCLFVDFTPFSNYVTNTNDNGPGSLRDAINQSNLSRSLNFIYFNIPGTPPHKIEPLTPLPIIKGPVNIDGTTQPANGFTGNSPKIELSGAVAGGTGLEFYPGNFLNTYPIRYDVAIYGLYIHDFSRGISTDYMRYVKIGDINKRNLISNNYIGAVFNRDNFLQVKYNYFGLDTSGTSAMPNYAGIRMINPLATGSHVFSNNVFSGNESGLEIWSGKNIVIKSNLFGTDPTGSFAIPNTDVALQSQGENVLIGGIGSSNGNLFSGNIAGSGYGAVTCSIFPHTIQSNKFGTNLTGTDTIPNIGSALYFYGANNNIVGGAGSNSRNIFAGTHGPAIILESAAKTIISYNYFGTDVTGTVNFPNSAGINFYFPCLNDSIKVNYNLFKSNGSGISVIGGCGEGHEITNNTISENGYGIFNGAHRVKISNNSIFNNSLGIRNCCGSNDSILPPDILYITPDSVVGTSRPFATIELFYSESQNGTPQGKTLFATRTANAWGGWKYTGNITDVLKVTTTQTDTNKNTSEFSPLWSTITDVVWPGDCNYDLKVNNIDFLYLNLAIGDTGSARSNASLNWIAQPASDWNNNYITEVNHKHADTDGNGTVLLNDSIAIALNYSLTHPFRIQMPSTFPAFKFSAVANTDTAISGSLITVNLIVSDTAGMPIDSIYGISYSLQFESDLVDTSQINLNYSGCVLGTYGTDLFSLTKNFNNLGYISSAICRNDLQNAVNVIGSIGSIQFMIPPGVPVNSVLHITPDDLLGLTAFEGKCEFISSGDSIVINPLNTGVADESREFNYLYPNPAYSDEAFYYNISDPTFNPELIQLFSVEGCEIFKKKIESGNRKIHFANSLSPGVYSVVFTSTKKIDIQRLVVLGR